MTVKKENTHIDWVDPDDAPDLSTKKWVDAFNKVSVKRGRPPIERPKKSTTVRLDADLLDHLRASGKGWQTRLNAKIREMEGL